MSSIDIYRVLRKIPNVSDDEAKHVAESMVINDQAITKADISALRAGLLALEARLEAKMLKLAIWTVVANVTLTVTLTVSLIKLL